MVNHFWQSVVAILESINLKTIIFQCFKNNGGPTHVTRLNVAPNMADPISLNEKRP